MRFPAVPQVGTWSRTVPNCVRPGCPAVESSLLPGSEAGRRRLTWREEHGGAVVRFACVKRALVMHGGAVLGCDGEGWNGTAPECRWGRWKMRVFLLLCGKYSNVVFRF